LEIGLDVIKIPPEKSRAEIEKDEAWNEMNNPSDKVRPRPYPG
jgi:hypothetical protein